VTARLLVTALVLASAALARAEAPAPRKLALDPLAVRGGVEPSLASVVEQRLCQALAEAAAGADLVCPEDVAAAASMARSEALMGRCPSDECMKKVEELRAAPRRVGGFLERDGKGLVLTLVLREDGVPDPRTASARLPQELDGLLAGVPGLVKKLF
jgi:hypothetical protein